MPWEGMDEDEVLRMESTPTSHLVIDGQEIEVHRCITDGAVVVSAKLAALSHKGHKFKQPVCLSRNEVQMIINSLLKEKAESELQ